MIFFPPLPLSISLPVDVQIYSKGSSLPFVPEISHAEFYVFYSVFSFRKGQLAHDGLKDILPKFGCFSDMP